MSHSILFSQKQCIRNTSLMARSSLDMEILVTSTSYLQGAKSESLFIWMARPQLTKISGVRLALRKL